MRVLRLAILACVASLVGCADVITTRPEALKEPLFVVIPANDTIFESDFASTVEKSLLAYGVRVATRPVSKAVRLENGGGGVEAGAESDIVNTGTTTKPRHEAVESTALLGDETRTVESFMQLSDTAANYRINSYAATRRVEIVDLSNGQILSIPVFGKGRLEAALTALGFSPTGTSADAPLSQAAPIFTVIPTTDVRGDTPFSLYVENMLIRQGLHVVRPPAPHYRTDSTGFEKSAARGKGRQAAALAASTEKVESYWVYDESPADYILETTLYRKRVKIIKKATSEVVSVVEIPDEDSDSAAKRLREALDKAHVAGPAI